jgi:hypothetical protein
MRDSIVQLFGKGTTIVDDPQPNLVIFRAKVVRVGKVDLAE